MKYFSILLVSITSIISVTGKIPEYIHVCKSNDSQLTECILNSILNIRPKLIEGIPELAVPPIDPLKLEKLVLHLGPGLKAVVHNLVLKGAKNFEIRDLTVDIKGNNYTFTVLIPEISASGTYELDTKLGSIPLKGKGPIHFTAKSNVGRGILNGKKVMRGGKTFYWLPSMNLKFEVGDYNVKLENLFSQSDTTIGDATNKLLNEEKTEILSRMLPVIEKAVTEYFLLAGNNICKHFTWDELFPDH